MSDMGARQCSETISLSTLCPICFLNCLQWFVKFVSNAVPLCHKGFSPGSPVFLHDIMIIIIMHQHHHYIIIIINFNTKITSNTCFQKIMESCEFVTFTSKWLTNLGPVQTRMQGSAIVCSNEGRCNFFRILRWIISTCNVNKLQFLKNQRNCAR